MKNSFVILCCYLGLVSEIFLVPVAAVRISSHSKSVCPPIHLKNGLAKRRGRGRVARFFCMRGFLLAGEKHSTCTRGRWDPPAPRCVRPTCKPITQQSNANLLIYPTHSGAVQHFFCKAGYLLRGPRDVYCNGTKWDDNIPSCLAVNEKPKLNCDFESADLCGWTHDLNHDFDWRRENYNTPSGSIGTGPSFDHTKGRGNDGYYMYIESSSRAENDTARLISPVYDKMANDVCFEFFYHMFGATIGSLRVYLKTVNENWDLNPNSSFFSKSGNQGDKWYRSYHHLGSIDNQFQIIIEGVRGNGYVSDIAIDDVRIIPDCPLVEETTTIMDSSTYNELIPTVDSCYGRCGQTELRTNETDHLTCDCDDDCYNDNRCCPDYYDICSGTTGTGEMDTTILATADEMTTETNPSPLKTFRSTTEPALFHRSTTTKKNTLHVPSTERILKSSTSSVPNVTKLSTKATTKMNRPVVYLETPPATPAIIRKFISTTPKPKPIPTVVRKFITNPPVTPSFATKKTTSSSAFHEHETTVGDAIEVPKPTNNDEAIYDVIMASKEYWSDEIENSVDTPSMRNFSESNKLFSQVKEADAKSHFAFIAGGLCAAVILITSVVFVVVKRYGFFRRTMSSSNGESQSDVRYLTNCDALDLSLANNYDELIS